MSNPLTIDEVLDLLKPIADQPLDWSITGHYSWRGCYSDLALTRNDTPSTVADFLTYLRDEALWDTVFGWKGGEYCISRSSSIHFTEHGSYDLGVALDEAMCLDMFGIEVPIERMAPKEWIEWVQSRDELVPLHILATSLFTDISENQLLEYVAGVPVSADH
jgi:hypothetical protein